MKYKAFRLTKAKGIYCQQTCTKGRPSERREKNKYQREISIYTKEQRLLEMVNMWVNRIFFSFII